MDAMGAKEFFISKIIGEAQFARTQLSEIERKMLYFTEVHPSIPGISEINAEFEQRYDSDEYEAKIVRLLKDARKRDSESSPSWKQDWRDAIDSLKHEDHYILVLLYSAFPEYRSALLPTHRVRDYVLYIAIGIAVVFVSIGIAVWSH